jgi:hypothetical protein
MKETLGEKNSFPLFLISYMHLSTFSVAVLPFVSSLLLQTKYFHERPSHWCSVSYPLITYLLAALRFELRASGLLGRHSYNLSHFTSPFFVMNYLPGAGFELHSF